MDSALRLAATSPLAMLRSFLTVRLHRFLWNAARPKDGAWNHSAFIGGLQLLALIQRKWASARFPSYASFSPSTILGSRTLVFGSSTKHLRRRLFPRATSSAFLTNCSTSMVVRFQSATPTAFLLLVGMETP